MLIPYVRSRAIGAIRARRASPLRFVADLLAIVILVRLIVGAYAVAGGAQRPFLGAIRAASPAAFAEWGIVLIAVLQQMGVHLVVAFPFEPYQRFTRYRTWGLRSIVYPALSPMAVGAGIVVLLLRGAGALPSLLVLYLAAVVGATFPALRASLAALALLSWRLGLREDAVLPLLAGATVGCLTLVHARRWYALQRTRETADAARGSIELRKELACWRYFRSDQIVTGLNCLSIAYVTWLVLTSDRLRMSLDRLYWLMPLLGLLPFARVIFNLLGTDASFAGHYRRYPARTAAYAWRRLRGYSLIGYGYSLAVATVLFRTLGTRPAVTYAFAAIAIIETALPCAACCSILLYEEKSVFYDHTANLLSRAPKLVLVVYAAIGLAVLVVTRAGGVVGLAAYAAAMIAVNRIAGVNGMAGLLRAGRWRAVDA